MAIAKPFKKVVHAERYGNQGYGVWLGDVLIGRITKGKTGWRAAAAATEDTPEDKKRSPVVAETPSAAAQEAFGKPAAIAVRLCEEIHRKAEREARERIDARYGT